MITKIQNLLEDSNFIVIFLVILSIIVVVVILLLFGGFIGMNLASQMGTIIGGILGPLTTAYTGYLMYLALKETRESSKASLDEQKKANLMLEQQVSINILMGFITKLEDTVDEEIKLLDRSRLSLWSLIESQQPVNNMLLYLQGVKEIEIIENRFKQYLLLFKESKKLIKFNSIPFARMETLFTYNPFLKCFDDTISVVHRIQNEKNAVFTLDINDGVIDNICTISKEIKDILKK